VLVAQDQAEAAAGAGRKRQPPRRREIGVIAHEFDNRRARRAALQRFLHRPQSVARTRHLEDAGRCKERLISASPGP
jgi:hypothetical protein